MSRKPSLSPTAGWVYDLVLRIFAPLLDIFFRDVQVRGSWRIPKQGAVILVAAPHANQFVDSLVLMRMMRALNRRVSWLMAEKSFDKPVIGQLASLIGAVPVSRAMDNTKAAEGTVFLSDSKEKKNLLRGVGTKFNGPSFQVGGSIYVPSKSGESIKLDIADILGPEEIIIKSPPTDLDVLQTLAGPVGTKYKVAPHVDQTAVYNAVFERLRKDGCIGIFPEGGSHDRSSLLPLKAGIAIMALEALAQGTNLTVVPVGMNYFHAHKFRSRAVVEFGNPVTISPDLVSDYKSGKRRETIGALLNTIYESLAAVTVTAPDYETLMLIQATRRLYSSKRSHIPLSAVLEINRRLIKGYTQYSQDPLIQNLSKSITLYNQQLQHLSLRDYQVEYARFSYIYVFSLLLLRIGKLLILSIGTLPGLLLFSPVFIAARYYSHQKTAEALAASAVKVKGNDVMATWKILIAAGLAPLLYTYYVIIIAVWTSYNRINGFVPYVVPIWTIVLGTYTIFPFLTFAALRLGEIGMDILKSLRPLVLCLSPSSAGTLVRLREQRRELSRRVTQLVDTLGPDMFPDCDAAKLPQPRRLYCDISPEDSLNELGDTEFFSIPTRGDKSV